MLFMKDGKVACLKGKYSKQLEYNLKWKNGLPEVLHSSTRSSFFFRTPGTNPGTNKVKRSDLCPEVPKKKAWAKRLGSCTKFTVIEKGCARLNSEFKGTLCVHAGFGMKEFDG